MEDFRYKTCSIQIKPDDDETLRNAIVKNIRRAEERLMMSLNEQLFSDFPVEISEEEIRLYERRKRIRRILAPWYWLKGRILMTWAVWFHGNCGECPREDW